MRRALLAALALAGTLGVGALWGGPGRFQATTEGLDAALAAAGDEAERGLLRFAYGDWGALSSDALRTSAQPWKLANAALALDAAGGDVAAAAQVDLATLYQGFGFLTPATLANWPEGLPRPPSDRPLGLNAGFAARLVPPLGATIGNIGCAACHASVTWSAEGTPDPTRAWLGAPNTSINLEAWTQALFQALRDRTADPDALMATVETLYPDTGWREGLTLRRLILPALRREVLARDAAFGRLLPYRASMAGATNGLDSLRGRLDLLPGGHLVEESVFNAVPDLSSRLWRDALLNTGSYAVAEEARGDPAARAEGLAAIIAYFTVPSMGVTEDVAAAHIPDAVEVTAWMAQYEPPPFPRPIDADLAARGRDLYAEGCASCHGTLDAERRLTDFPNWQGDVGTDPARAALLTPDVLDAIRESFGDRMVVRAPSGYAAPPLTGLWASAPYLHNGSVPTLWHLLHPAECPETFEVGGHRLDLDRVGIDLDPPETYAPWSTPALVDTTTFGLGNGGHAFGADLSDADKAALLEYLKML